MIAIHLPIHLPDVMGVQETQAAKQTSTSLIKSLHVIKRSLGLSKPDPTQLADTASHEYHQANAKKH